MLGLRQIIGIDASEFRQRHGVAVRDLAPAAYDHFLNSGLLETKGNCIRLTEEGRFLADTVVSEFL